MTKSEKKEFILDNLACPKCRQRLNPDLRKCPDCGNKFEIRNDNTPVFIDENSSYIDRRAENNATNPYSPKSLEIIRNNPDAKILDFGAGNPREEELFDNVIRHEFVHYKSTDIVSTEKNIPFHDEIFDFVISESVFEHVRDPFHCAKEIHRVLKRGGIVIVDTAFLQPVHADPYHFFNMTLEGLKEVFRDFEEIRSGVESYQTASHTLNILMKTYCDLIDDEKVKNDFREKFLVDFHKYNKYIPPEKQYIMSAGVYFVGRKR